MSVISDTGVVHNTAIVQVVVFVYIRIITHVYIIVITVVVFLIGVVKELVRLETMVTLKIEMMM